MHKGCKVLYKCFEDGATGDSQKQKKLVLRKRPGQRIDTKKPTKKGLCKAKKEQLRARREARTLNLGLFFLKGP